MTYLEAMHAIQTGIAAVMKFDESMSDPKHLRVGIDSCHVTDHAIAALLMAKGVFTEEEYLEQIRLSAIKEVKRYEDTLSRLYDKPIKLL